MRVMYLTWGETPRSYGVFNSQVLQQFISNKKQIGAHSAFHFVSAVPLIHSGLVREKLGYALEIKKIKKILHSASVSFKKLPIFSTQNFVNASKKTFPLFHLGTRRLLVNEIMKFKADIVHCRSYHAAWAALKAREEYNLNYKVVFDGRGIWPYEIALKKNYPDDGENLKFLLDIESYCLINADAVVAVSKPMASYYKSVFNRDIDTIYLSSDTEKFKPRIQRIVNKDIPHFCYVGALAENTWHKPKVLKELFHHLHFLFPRAKFTVVTTSDHGEIKKEFLDFTGEICYKSTHCIEQLQQILEDVDFGVMSYFTPETKREKLLGSSVMAVKTAEYLASGLPNIVNKYCGGAADVVDEFDVGIVYDPKCLDSLSSLKINSALSIEVKNRALKLAKNKFDYQSNAILYTKLYERLL